MADQQNLPVAEVDHLDVARNLMGGRHMTGVQGPETAQAHALIDIAMSLRGRVQASQSVVDVQGFADTLADDRRNSPRGGHVVVVREEDWIATLEVFEHAIAQGLHPPAMLVAELRSAVAH